MRVQVTTEGQPGCANNVPEPRFDTGLPRSVLFRFTQFFTTFCLAARRARP